MIPKHLEIAQQFVNNLKELGNNQGWNMKDVEIFLKEKGWHKGDSWCAWIWCYILTLSGAKSPIIYNGLARNYFTKGYKPYKDISQIEIGDFVIFQKDNTVFGHLACIESINKDGTVALLEGNTSSGIKGSQSNGDGFYRRTRKLNFDYKPFHVFGFSKVLYE